MEINLFFFSQVWRAFGAQVGRFIDWSWQSLDESFTVFVIQGLVNVKVLCQFIFQLFKQTVWIYQIHWIQLEFQLVLMSYLTVNNSIRSLQNYLTLAKRSIFAKTESKNESRSLVKEDSTVVSLPDTCNKKNCLIMTEATTGI